jgi:hypothetical protein
MAMFGEVAFTVQPAEEQEDVLASLSKLVKSKPVVTAIDEQGARFV